MMYLSGARHPQVADDLQAGRIGLLTTPGTGYALDSVAVWALDNGCFTGRYPGDEAYMRLMERYAAHRSRCLFVVVPDVVGDAAATLAQFPAMAARIRQAGWPVAIVGQDGMERLDVPWSAVDWLFVGGSTDWKLSPGAVDLIRQAQAHGKRVHVGRVNSARRFARFAALDVDSADGTCLAFGADANAPRIRAWIRAASQPTLWRLGVVA